MAGNGEGGEGWQKMIKEGGERGYKMVGIEGGEGLHAYLMEYKR